MHFYQEKTFRSICQSPILIIWPSYILFRKHKPVATRSRGENGSNQLIKHYKKTKFNALTFVQIIIFISFVWEIINEKKVKLNDE